MNALVSKEQINALKYLILKSQSSGPETKKVCFALIDASEGLTKPVCFTGYSEDITYGVHDMSSSLRNTHLGALMKLIGTNFEFSDHDGYFSKTGEFLTKIHPEEKRTRTIWLSSKPYDREAEKVTVEQVEAVELVDPLYK
jgi:hypothetical protein